MGKSCGAVPGGTGSGASGAGAVSGAGVCAGGIPCLGGGFPGGDWGGACPGSGSGHRGEDDGGALRRLVRQPDPQGTQMVPRAGGGAGVCAGGGALRILGCAALAGADPGGRGGGTFARTWNSIETRLSLRGDGGGSGAVGADGPGSAPDGTDPAGVRAASAGSAGGAIQELCHGLRHLPGAPGCKTRNLLAGLDPSLLEQPGLSEEDVPPGCKKQTRLITELRRGQEQLRRIKGDGNRAMAYRQACQDQFGFLAEFLEGLSDDLARRNAYKEPKFHPEIGMSTRSREEINGDKCVWFEGIGNRFYVLLCDGMGTGEEAARESEDAVKLVKQMLLAGLPAEYALRSMNALAVLRQMGGCATVDLVELWLDTGKGTVYKWGAAPSYVMSAGQLKKIGTAGPPPGLANTARETVDRLSLGRGELLILLSDGVSEGGLLDSARTTPMQPPGEMAAAILEKKSSGGDDATAVVIKLIPGRLSAS